MDSLAQSLDGGLAHLGIHIGAQTSEDSDLRRVEGSGVTQNAHRFAAYITVRRLQEAGNEVHRILLLPAQHPKRLNPAGRRGGFIRRHFAQGFGRRGLRSTVGQGLPRQMRVADDVTAEAGDEFRRGKFRVVGHRRWDEALGLNAPDTTRLLIAIGVVTGDFVVADNLVIPVDDIEAAIGAHRHRDGAKERVITGDEVGQLLQRVAGTIAVHPDGVHLRGDGVGDIHDVGIALGPNTMITEGETTQASPTHLELRSLNRERRLVGLRQAVSATRVPSILMKRHDRIAVVIGLLNKSLTLPVQHETPNITGTRTGGLEETTIRPEARHARRRKINGLTLRRRHFTGIESPLREPEPTTRRAGKLVRE